MPRLAISQQANAIVAQLKVLGVLNGTARLSTDSGDLKIFAPLAAFPWLVEGDVVAINLAVFRVSTQELPEEEEPPKPRLILPMQ